MLNSNSGAEQNENILTNTWALHARTPMQRTKESERKMREAKRE